MTNVRMKAVDTLHLSGIGPDNLVAGQEFDVPTGVADDLEQRGLARRVADAPEAKAQPAPANKAVKAAPANKAAPAKRKARK